MKRKWTGNQQSLSILGNIHTYKMLITASQRKEGELVDATFPHY